MEYSELVMVINRSSLAAMIVLQWGPSIHDTAFHARDAMVTMLVDDRWVNDNCVWEVIQEPVL